MIAPAARPTAETKPASAPVAGSPAAGTGAKVARKRLDSVDLLRGLVMVIMALDHARDYFTNARFDPTDLTRTDAPLFLTRWITHFCAPVFVFLAGTSVSLSMARGRSRREQARFLLTRGVWLVFLELTFVRLGWSFDYFFPMVGVQVIWALGWSMIAMAGIVFLPRKAIVALAVVMIAGHNLLDGIQPASFGSFAWLWTALHVQGPVPLPGGVRGLIIYPLVPWIGVMAAGYTFGALLERPEQERRRTLALLGLSLTGVFIVLRALNVYGDPSRWASQPSGVLTALSFLRTTKYPPSLLYLLMTLGPAIGLLALLERASGPAARFFLVFGRVPLFYYLLHIYVIHGLTVLAGWLSGTDPRALTGMFMAFPPGYGWGLPVVYLVWGLVVVGLYPACRWFAGVKARRRDWWLSYL